MRVSLGAVLDGSLEGGGQRFELGTGIVGSVGVAHQWLRGPWFVTATLALGASRATTRAPAARGDRVDAVSITATDLRAGVMAGRALGPVRPYVLARGFGGPVFWSIDGEDVTGTDTRKFQLGAGASLALPRDLALLVDVSVLGERAASLGMAVSL